MLVADENLFTIRQALMRQAGQLRLMNASEFRHHREDVLACLTTVQAPLELCRGPEPVAASEKISESIVAHAGKLINHVLDTMSCREQAAIDIDLLTVLLKVADRASHCHMTIVELTSTERALSTLVERAGVQSQMPVSGRRRRFEPGREVILFMLHYYQSVVLKLWHVVGFSTRVCTLLCKITSIVRGVAADTFRGDDYSIDVALLAVEGVRDDLLNLL